jgi:hypothetical protein
MSSSGVLCVPAGSAAALLRFWRCMEDSTALFATIGGPLSRRVPLVRCDAGAGSLKRMVPRAGSGHRARGHRCS